MSQGNSWVLVISVISAYCVTGSSCSILRSQKSRSGCRRSRVGMMTVLLSSLGAASGRRRALDGRVFDVWAVATPHTLRNPRSSGDSAAPSDPDRVPDRLGLEPVGHPAQRRLG